MKPASSSLIIAITATSQLLCASPTRAADHAPADCTQWIPGYGSFTDPAHWSPALPNPFQRTEIHGNSTVTVPPGAYPIGDLEIGLNNHDHSQLIVDGGQLILLQDSLRVGEETGSDASFILKAGAMHCFMDVFVGAASSVAGRANHSTLRIEAGSFLARTLTVGLGWGATSRVEIIGSQSSAIHILDYIQIESHATTAGSPGNTSLAFTLDSHGVTPITIQSPYRGLTIAADPHCHTRLAIALSTVPPRDDITLIRANVPTQGTFDNLPESSEIKTDYAGHIYRWKLTYHGGAQHHDLVLLNQNDYPPNAPRTTTNPPPTTPNALWLQYRTYPLTTHLDGQPAFDGAQGFGANAAGGRNGQTINVVNLNDSGPGSLRTAIETPGPRTIHFQVAGTIPLKSTLIIKDPNITIDGEDAPAPGITLINRGIEVHTHDVILRYLRIRVGDQSVDRSKPKWREEYEGGAGEHALYFIDGASNCIADHLSLSWSTTKILSITKLSDRITVQWCILSQALNFADHGYASLAGGDRVTWHHNLFAHNNSRNVRFQGMVDADFRNNVIYDPGERAAYGEFDRLNYVGNYLKAGPSTNEKPYLFFHLGDAEVMPGSLYVQDNILEGKDAPPGVNQDNWRGMGGYYHRKNLIAATQPFPAPPVTTESAQDAYNDVLAHAGATLPQRDATDQRIIHEVETGTGRIINWVSDLGHP